MLDLTSTHGNNCKQPRARKRRFVEGLCKMYLRQSEAGSSEVGKVAVRDYIQASEGGSEKFTSTALVDWL